MRPRGRRKKAALFQSDEKPCCDGSLQLTVGKTVFERCTQLMSGESLFLHATISKGGEEINSIDIETVKSDDSICLQILGKSLPPELGVFLTESWSCVLSSISDVQPNPEIPNHPGDQEPAKQRSQEDYQEDVSKEDDCEDEDLQLDDVEEMDVDLSDKPLDDVNIDAEISTFSETETTQVKNEEFQENTSMEICRFCKKEVIPRWRNDRNINTAVAHESSDCRFNPWGQKVVRPHPPVSEQYPIGCRYCPKGFNRDTLHTIHESKCMRRPCYMEQFDRAEMKLDICLICDVMCASPLGLKYHHNKHHSAPEGPCTTDQTRWLNCANCKYYTNSEHQLVDHMSVHTSHLDDSTSERITGESPSEIISPENKVTAASFPNTSKTTRVSRKNKKKKLVDPITLCRFCGADFSGQYRSARSEHEANQCSKNPWCRKVLNPTPSISEKYPYACRYCIKKGLSKISLLRIHEAKCMRKPSYMLKYDIKAMGLVLCPICGIMSASPNGLRIHTKRLHNGKVKVDTSEKYGNLVCKICRFHTNCQEKLMNHKCFDTDASQADANQSSDNPGNVCRFCRTEIPPFTESLSQHETHCSRNPWSGKVLFPATTVCEKFPIQCRYCPKAFTRQSVCDIHETRKCARRPSYMAKFDRNIAGMRICDLCDMMVNGDIGLILHRVNTHGISSAPESVDMKSSENVTAETAMECATNSTNSLDYDSAISKQDRELKHNVVQEDTDEQSTSEEQHQSIQHKPKRKSMRQKRFESSLVFQPPQKGKNDQKLSKICRFCGKTCLQTWEAHESNGCLRNPWSHHIMFPSTTVNDNAPIGCRYCTRGFLKVSYRDWHELKCARRPDHMAQFDVVALGLIFCSLCGVMCHSKLGLYLHMNGKHKLRREQQMLLEDASEEANPTDIKHLLCDVCGYKTDSSDRLEYHRTVHASTSNDGGTVETTDVHSKSETETCRFCHEALVFTSEDKKRSYVRLFHEKSCFKNPWSDNNVTPSRVVSEQFPVGCKFCPRGFTTQARSRCHAVKCVRRPHNMAQYDPVAMRLVLCDDCGIMCSSESGLSSHKVTKHGYLSTRHCSKIRKPFIKSTPCQYCHHVFTTPYPCLKHEQYRCPKNPNKIKLHHCTTCGFESTDIELFRQHKDSEEHQNAPTSVCNICGKILPSRNRLLSHERTHRKLPIKVLPHKCPFCCLRFAKETSRQNHMRKHSHPAPRVLCQVCGQYYKNKIILSRHMNNVHSNIYQYHCQCCGHGMRSKRALKTHVCGRVISRSAKRYSGLGPARPKCDKPVDTSIIQGLGTREITPASMGIEDRN